ncbi:MAG: sugar MFS transporter [Bacteroidota bacterium]|jgi:FHS family L-fucose permease-like MFS transporter
MALTTSTLKEPSVHEDKPVSNAGIALASLMTLFFMMGFITCLNDILIPYMKAIFQLNYAQANFINLCFFGAYFFMSIPSGMLINRIGYKKSMIAGFIIAAIGCFLFYPAAGSKIYGLFLAALFILASGITLLQVAGNPYVAALGPSSSSSARLTLTQAFNSVGTTIAPYFGSMLILSGLPKDVSIIENIDVSAVQKPYIWIGLLLVAIAAVLVLLKLPAIEHGGKQQNTSAKKAWQYPHLVLGAVGIFCYVGAEVAIGSHIVSYLQLPDVMGMQADEAGKYVSYYWGGAMIGRFIGSWILSKFKPGNVLAFNALMAFVLVMISILSGGATAMWSLLAVGLFNSLMFATIFTLAVEGLGAQTDEGSGILCTAIVGGALIPFLYGITGDIFSLKTAYLLPALCYIYIIYYGLKGYKHS